MLHWRSRWIHERWGAAWSDRGQRRPDRGRLRAFGGGDRTVGGRLRGFSSGRRPDGAGFGGEPFQDRSIRSYGVSVPRGLDPTDLHWLASRSLPASDGQRRVQTVSVVEDLQVLERRCPGRCMRGELLAVTRVPAASRSEWWRRGAPEGSGPSSRRRGGSLVRMWPHGHGLELAAEGSSPSFHEHFQVHVAPGVHETRVGPPPPISKRDSWTSCSEVSARLTGNVRVGPSGHPAGINWAFLARRRNQGVSTWGETGSETQTPETRKPPDFSGGFHGAGNEI